ncbi:hypothetical protein [Vibrio sp. B181a]|uniref:hypothetical protein n=1 Tax=Vibrio sp. B181a TaxID=2835906 RepID=UPI002554B037|nr:hypothetical protein [Vibrio sp. B181a]MDK9770105.1 hypothetical protein [Vibrio sp. B181a]
MSNQHLALTIVDSQVQIEADSLASVFLSFDRMKNYVRLDKQIAYEILDKMYKRACEAEERFPALKGPSVNKRTYLMSVCADVREFAIDIELEMQAYEHKLASN